MPVTLTEAAAEQIKTMLAAQPGSVGLRMGVTESGCSGLSYDMDLADTIADSDAVFESHGVKVVVDKAALTALEGTQLDYVAEGLNRLFKFNNPNAKNACGCGESFSV